MKRLETWKLILILLAGALVCVPTASADVGADWVEAMKKGKAKAAAKVSVATNFKYGADGKSTVIADKLERHFKKAFRGLRKAFKDATLEQSDCTSLGRELGYMATEWKDTDETMAEWIRGIPETFCTGEGLHPPKVTLLKVLGGELPHALIVVHQGEDPKVIGAYHF